MNYSLLVAFLFVCPTYSLQSSKLFISKCRFQGNGILFLTKKQIRASEMKDLEEYIPQESYGELLDDVEQNKFQEIYFSNDMRKVYALKKLDEPNQLLYFDDFRVTYVNPTFSQSIVDSSRKSHTKMFVLPEPQNGFTLISQWGSLVNGFLSGSFYMFLLYSIIMTIFSRGTRNSGMPGNMNSPFSNGGLFGGGSGFRNDLMADKNNMIKANITLSDWAGSPEIFEECNEVVSYLRNDTNYKMAGAQIPKGILLEGSPGTGKTLIAKAIASECDANFISVASSEFVEVFVGLGAQKVRNLFKQARENTPCILFIDEIDSIGKQRGTGINLGNDEREQTLNQLLAEMDGFNSNEGVLIIAATNRRDVLDSALLRPGRFDRVINVPLPDKDSRKEIFKVHTKNKELEPNIEYEFLAELSAGFSGAQIKNLVNEAAILAAREARIQISQKDLEDSLEKLVVGIVKRTDTRGLATRTRVAIHEAGHAILSVLFSEYFDLKKVTIQATYNGAGGYTLFNDKEETSSSGLYTKEALKKRLVVSMGGKAAEWLIYGENFVSLGAVQDLKTANQLAQTMIGNYGMGEELNVFYNENIESAQTPFLGRSLATGDKYSEKTKEILDLESLSLVKEAYSEAQRLLLEYKSALLKVSNLLLRDTTLPAQVVYDLIQNEYVDESNNDKYGMPLQFSVEHEPPSFIDAVNDENNTYNNI